MFTFDATVSKEREAALTAKLVAYNKALSPLWDENHDGQFVAAPLHVFVRDNEGEVIGGLTGRTHSIRAWMEVSILWVDEAYRGRGLGQELMERAEVEAIRRGCRFVRLATSDYQAPDFYEKLGYVLYGKLEDCPPGETVHYYRKNLTSYG